MSRMGVENGQPEDRYGRRTEWKGAGPGRLGDVVEQMVEREILPRQVRFGRLVEAWEALLPAELRQHCRIADVAGGQVKVVADSPSYVYELQLCSGELLKQVQQRCPRLGIKAIKFAIG